MKVIDAVWEKRNLGVTTQEIVVESSDSLDDLNQVINSLNSDYAVVKIPCNKMDFTSYVENNGFRYVENQFSMSGDIKTVLPVAEKTLARYKSFTVEQNNTSEMYDSIAIKIKEGIFHNDRIALDPKFGEIIANKRYANWLLDLKNDKDVYLQIMKKDGVMVGFNLNRDVERISYGLIGGILKPYQNEPLGLYWGAAILKNVSERSRISLWQASVSSNNWPIIRVWESFGMKISNILTIFVKHKQ